MEIGASPTQVFGSPSTDSLFAAGLSQGASPEQETARVTIDAHRAEINRIRGYKLRLTPAEKNKLGEIQVRVQEIEGRATEGTVRDDELEERTQLLKDADEIIGKQTVDVEADQFLANTAGILEALLAPKLDPATAAKVERLERVKDNLENLVNERPESKTLRSQFQSITVQLNSLTPPRPVSTLSPAGLKAYDDLAELINDHAGAKIQLNSRETIRVVELEASIISLQGLLPPDPSQQPTSAAVSRAYTRLG